MQEQNPLLVTGLFALDYHVPELDGNEDKPYDPFKVDLYALGRIYSGLNDVRQAQYTFRSQLRMITAMDQCGFSPATHYVHDVSQSVESCRRLIRSGAMAADTRVDFCSFPAQETAIFLSTCMVVSAVGSGGSCGHVPLSDSTSVASIRGYLRCRVKIAQAKGKWYHIPALIDNCGCNTWRRVYHALRELTVHCARCWSSNDFLGGEIGVAWWSQRVETSLSRRLARKVEHSGVHTLQEPWRRRTSCERDTILGINGRLGTGLNEATSVQSGYCSITKMH